MSVYLFLLFFVLLLLFSSKKDRVLDKRYGTYAFVLLMIVCGLRGIDVGTDTSHYISAFEGKSERMEPLFQLICNIIRNIGFSYHSFLFVIAMLTYIPLIFFVRKESSSVAFSALVYLSFSVMFFPQTQNVIRSTLAISIYLCTLYYFKERHNLKLSILLSFAACTIHYVSIPILIVSLLLYYIRGLNFKWVFVGICASISFGLLFSTGFSEYADQLSMLDFFYNSDEGAYYSRYVLDFNEDSHNMTGILATMLPFSIFALLIYDEENRNSLYYKLFVFGCILTNCFVSVGYTYRLTMFLSVLLIVLLPNAINKTQNIIIKNSLVGLSSFMVIWYIYSLITATPGISLAGTVPYEFFWNNN